MTAAAADILEIRSYLRSLKDRCASPLWRSFEQPDPAHTGAALVPAAWEQLRRESQLRLKWDHKAWYRAVDRYCAALETAYGLREAGFPGELIAAAFGPAEAR